MPWNKDQMHEKISKRKFRSNFFQLNLFCQLWHILPAYTWDRNPNFVLTQLQLWDMIAHISLGKQARKWQIININSDRIEQIDLHCCLKPPRRPNLSIYVEIRSRPILLYCIITKVATSKNQTNFRLVFVSVKQLLYPR